MFTRAFLMVGLFVTVPLWAQEQTSAPVDTTATSSADDSQMFVPPPVSGASYATEGTSQERSNYLRGGLTFNTAYTDNLLQGTSTKEISDVSYSIWPTIALDETTTRVHATFTYTPGFTFYQHTSSRNEADQNFNADFQYRLSPHVTLSLRDTLHKSSNVFNQLEPVGAIPVSGSAQAPTIGVIAPIADQLSNNGNAELTYQFSPNGMIGASGTFTNLYFFDSSQTPGLSNSDGSAGSAFYNHRLSKKNYIGATYQYNRYVTYPVGAQSVSQTNGILVFYTVYLQPTLSVSFSGGPQHTDLSQSPFLSFRQWSPAGTASLGWQGHHTSASASYSRIVTGGGGLVGAFHSNNANGSVRQQLSPNWSAGITGAYSIYKTVDPFSNLSPTTGGHTVTGSVSVQRRLGQHFNGEAGYTRLHQSYSNIAAIANFPNVNREWISITYQLVRPLGR
jgi:hypothetical protein